MHSEGERLRSSAEHAELVGALRNAADAAGVHVVINARTDLFLRQDGDESDRVDRAVARLTELPPRRVPTPCTRSAVTIRIRCGGLASELPLPINAIALPDQDDPGVVRPARRGPDQLRPVPAGGAVRAGQGDPGPLALKHSRRA